MKIEIIPCLSDNFSYLIHDIESDKVSIVDPGEYKACDNVIKKYKKLDFILNTHHHADHVDGNLELKKKYNSKVLGFELDKDRIPGIDILLKENQKHKIGKLEFEVIFVPGHTKGHVAFFFFIFNPESIWMPNLGILLLSIVSTFLSFLIQFLIQSIVACLCFWTEKASSIERLLFIPTLFLSGLLAPVVSFPAYVKSWIYLTPFPYLIDFPANLLSGNETNISGGLIMQILWIFILFPLFKKIWSEGTKKYTAWGHEFKKISNSL